MGKNKLTWKDVKAILADKPKAEFLKLIGDLYALSDENKIFVHSRYSIGNNPLTPPESNNFYALYTCLGIGAHDESEYVAI